MDKIYYYLDKITTNPVVLCIIVIVASCWCFLYLEQLLKGRDIRKKTYAVSVINGILCVILISIFKVTSPIILLILSPALIMAELVLIHKGSVYTHSYLLVKLLVNFICIYWMIASLVGIISVNHIQGDYIYSLTMLASGWWCRSLAYSKKYPMDELRIMVNEKKMGVFHFSFLCACAVSLLFSTLVLRPIIIDGTDLYGTLDKIRKIFFIEMYLKTLLVFISGYLLLFLQAKELREKENSRSLSLDLEKEEEFRKSIQQEAFISFYVNATADQIQEGRDFFTPFMWHDINNYAEMLQKMAFLCIHPEDLTTFIELNTLENIEEKMAQGITSERHNMRVQPKETAELIKLPKKIKDYYANTEEEYVWIKIKYVYTKDSETDDICIFVSMIDIHDKMKASEALIKDATQDKLTGIYNRAAFEKLVNEKLNAAAREKKDAGTFILLDVDSFKSVNDLLGHPVGDVALQTVASKLKEIFRQNDIVGRLGGDEFCVFMNGATDENIIRTRLERINRLCRKDYPVPGQEAIHVSVSIGAVICKGNEESYESVYQCADEALYHTKEQGKNSYTLYSDLTGV